MSSSFIIAYIDPGSGSLIYQTLLTILLGLAFVLRRAGGSISRFVKRLFGKRDDAWESVTRGRP
jgi:hypothetical protein